MTAVETVAQPIAHNKLEGAAPTGIESEKGICQIHGVPLDANGGHATEDERYCMAGDGE